MTGISLALPKYEDAMNRLYDEIYDGFHMLDKILGLFPIRRIIHGGVTRQVSTPKILDTSPQAYRSTFRIESEMFVQTDVTKFQDFLFELVTSLQNQQRKHTFDIIFKTSDATGNTIDGKSRDFCDVYIEALQKVDIKFDKNGRHGYKLLMNSETAKKVTEVPPTEEQLKRAKDIIDAKRQAHFLKRRSRRVS